MQIQHATRAVREVCALRHLSINTEKTYTHWLGRYGSFLKDPKLKTLTSEKKIEAFLTRLALSGVAASTQNQAFNAVLFFYREVLRQELGPVDSLRAKRPAAIRQCPTPNEVSQLLATVSDIYQPTGNHDALPPHGSWQGSQPVERLRVSSKSGTCGGLKCVKGFVKIFCSQWFPMRCPCFPMVPCEVVEPG
jgi:hypothetical protein